MRRLLIVPLLLIALQARGQTLEQWNIWAQDLEVDGGVFLGSATRGNATHTETKNFNSFGSFPWATAKISIPPWIASPPVLTCSVLYRTATTDPTKKAGFRFGVLASVFAGAGPGVHNLWDGNQGIVLGGSSISGTIQGAADTVAESTVSTNAIVVPVYNQGTSAQCASTIVCTSAAVRFYVDRDNTIPNNDPNDIELIKVTCLAPTT